MPYALPLVFAPIATRSVTREVSGNPDESKTLNPWHRAGAEAINVDKTLNHGKNASKNSLEKSSLV
jgi:hypothetical protein